MNRALLVPLDGSDFGAAALPLASRIASLSGCAMHLVYVHLPVVTQYVDGTAIVDVELDIAGREADRSYLETMQQQLAAHHTALTSTVLDGPVAVTLAAHATAIRAELIVMSTHGRGGLARMWLGSVADELIRHSHVPILLLRPHEEPAAPPPTITKIVIPLDGSALAEQILVPAQQLGHLFNVEYTLIQVVDAMVLNSSPLMVRSPAYEYDVLHVRKQAAEHYLDTVAARLRAEGQRVTTRVLVDSQPAAAILHEAGDQPQTLVALATHGRSGVTRMLVGSVADKVLRGANTPVLLYRPQSPTIAT